MDVTGEDLAYEEGRPAGAEYAYSAKEPPANSVVATLNPKPINSTTGAAWGRGFWNGFWAIWDSSHPVEESKR